MAETNVKIKLLTDIQSSLDALATFQKQATKSIGAVEDSTVGLSNSFKRIGEFAVGGILKDAVVAGFNAAKDAISSTVRSAVQLENALTGLRAVASSTGNDVDGVTAIAKRLSEDGLIPLADTAAALKNLLATGIDADKAEKAFLALRDAAAFNRQGQLQLGEAVVGATQGIKNQLSVLVDNAGITKNLSVLQKEYAASIGKTVGQLTEKEKVLANVNGVIREAAIFQGNYNLLLDTFSGATSKVSGNITFLSAEIGELITRNKSVLIVVNAFAGILKDLRIQLGSNQSALSTFVSKGVVLFIDGLRLAFEALDAVIKGLKLLGLGFEKFTTNVAFAIAVFKKYTGGAEEADGIIQSLSASLVELNKQAGEITGTKTIFGDLADKLKDVGKSAQDATGQLTGGAANVKNGVKDTTVEVEKLKTSIKDLSSGDLGQIVIRLKSDLKLSGAEKDAVAVGVTNAILTGAKGAAKVVAQVAGGFAETLIPGIGGAVAQIVEVLAQGPAKVQELIDGFINALPDIALNVLEVITNIGPILANVVDAFIANVISKIDRVIESLIFGSAQAFLNLLNKIPDIVLKLVELAPLFIQKLTEDAPKIIQRLADQSGFIIEKLVAVSPKLIDALIIQSPKLIEALITNIVIQIPRIISGLALAFKDALVDAAKGFVDEIKRQAGNLAGGGIKKTLGFAEGGKVPAGFNNDNFPARLTSGELVVPRDTVRSLESFLSKQNSGSISADGFSAMIGLLQRIESKIGSEDIVVNVGGKQLIATIRENIKSGRVLA